MGRRVNVIGVGMVKFQKPGASDEYNVMASNAIREAMKDAGVKFEHIEQAFAGYVYGDSTCGQRAVYEVGLTGIPVFNVNNNCSTGSLALMLARQAVAGGLAECVLAVGFEQMQKGALSAQVDGPHEPARSPRERDERGAGLQSGAAGRRADVRRRGPRVPLEVRHQARDLREDRGEGAQARVEEPVRALQGDVLLRRGDPGLAGGLRSAHALPVLPAHVRRGGGHPLLGRLREEARRSGAVYIAGQAMTTDYALELRGGHSMIKMVGFDMAKNAAKKVYEQAGLGPKDVQVVELHDCFTANELLTYEALGLCERGRGREVHLGRRQHLRRQVGHQPLGRPAQRRATRSARPASRSAPSSSGSCAAPRASARSRATRRWRSSTTSASAAPAS
jgi:sterol carrier protein 2